MGATVYLPDLNVGTYTDEFGSYNIRVGSSKNMRLVFSYPGYNADTIVVTQPTNNAYLSLAYAEVVIVKSSEVESISTGVVNYNIEKLQRLPVILGEADLLKAIINSAGVQGGAEGTSGINVRGGGDDQNLYLLDGSTIYNPNHVFGFLSLFQPPTVKYFRLYKGYIPPKYSGRLSSVLEVATKAGNTDTIRREVTLGLVTNSFTINGPIKNRKNTVERTFLLAGRLANTVPFSLISQATGLLSEDGPRVLAGMYDLNLKLTNRYSRNRTLDFSVYLGDDLWGGRQAALNSRTISGSEIIWGNKLISLRYHRPNPDGITAESGVNLNRYANSYRTFERGEGIDNQVLTRSSINEVRLSHRYKFVNELVSWNGGVELLASIANPVELLIQDRELETQTNNNLSNTMESRAHSSISLRPSASLAVDAGVSVSVFNNSADKYSAVYAEPRFGASFRPFTNSKIGLSYSVTAQPVHRLSSFAFGLPYDIWTSASEKFPVAKANQASMEFAYQATRVRAVVAGYYKRMRDLLYPPNNGVLPTIGSNNSEQLSPLDNVATSGQGRTYGVEVTLEYATNSTDITLNYSYSRSFRTFSSVNRGREFPFDFDRPHDLTVTGGMTLSPKWKFNGLFAIQSGRIVTTPTSIIENIFRAPSPLYASVNNLRLNAYHRLDISFQKEFITKKKKRQAKLTLGIYNVYARKNPVRAFVDELTELGGSSIDGPIGYNIVTRSVLLSIPAITYARSW